MTTNVQQRTEILAGILSDIEIFTVKGEKNIYAMHSGVRKMFSELPSIVQQFFRQECLEDVEFTAFAKDRWGVEGFYDVFYHRMDCLYGPMDTVPDFNETTGAMTADTNSWCGDLDCEMAGIKCRMPYNLSKDEVYTMMLIKRGNTTKAMAPLLNLAKPSVISRVEALKVKFAATNTPNLIYKTSEIH